MLCSPLNDHLYSHIHVIDDPSCACGNARETNKHYLLECALHTGQRKAMLEALHELDFEPTLSNILQGNEKYSHRKNEEAFKIIQDFIQDSNRFD